MDQIIQIEHIILFEFYKGSTLSHIAYLTHQNGNDILRIIRDKLFRASQTTPILDRNTGYIIDYQALFEIIRQYSGLFSLNTFDKLLGVKTTFDFISMICRAKEEFDQFKKIDSKYFVDFLMECL
jgi:hypothetical protein